MRTAPATPTSIASRLGSSLVTAWPARAWPISAAENPNRSASSFSASIFRTWASGVAKSREDGQNGHACQHSRARGESHTGVTSPECLW